LILALILALVLILVLILVLPVGIGMKYENGVFFIVKAAFLSFSIPFEKKIKKPSKKAKNKTNEEKSKPGKSPDREIDGIDFILDVFGASRKFVRKHVALTSFELNIELGTGNAASTAIGVGAIWGIAYNMLSLIDKLVQVKKPKVDVKPNYGEASFAIRAQGIIEARIVHIIAIAVIFVYKYFKHIKNEEEK
jgi:uncharacterized membrane protein